MKPFIYVPFYNHVAEYREIQSSIDEAIHRVLLSGEYEQGPEVTSFEDEFAGYLGTTCAVTTGSCHDAMYRAMKTLDVGAGDEVITVSNSDIACTAAIHRTGARVAFAEIDAKTHNIDPEDLASRIKPQTRAILLVHMYGLPANIEAVQQIAERHDLKIIEDCALAVGATVNGRKVGTFGDAGCFSHAPSKILGTYGDGGTLVTQDARRADAARHMHLYWQMREMRSGTGPVRVHAGFHLIEEGSHARMVEWTAAVLRAKLSKIDEWIDIRRKIARVYNERLKGFGIGLPPICDDHVYRNFTVTVPGDRDVIRLKLASSGIETGMHYTPPLHVQPVYADLGFKTGDLPVTERVAEQMFTLPIYPQLSEAQIEWICESLVKAVQC